MRKIEITKEEVMQTKAATYSRRTPSRNVYIAGLGVWVGSPLHIGNTKIGKNVAILSLLEHRMCLNCEECKAGCYAHKATVAYPTVAAHRYVYSWLALHDLPLFFRLIVVQLNNIVKNNNRRRIAVDTVRIHEAGDFFSQEYIDGWATIARLFPGLKYYFYTEVAGIFDFSGLASLPNVNMVSSRLPDGGLNFGPEEVIVLKAKEQGVHVCPCGRPGWKPGACGRACTWCHSHGFVAFVAR